MFCWINMKSAITLEVVAVNVLSWTSMVLSVSNTWWSWPLHYLTSARCFTELAKETGTISDEIIRSAVSKTENGFLTLVRRAYAVRPDIAAIGSCCLVGVIWKGTLYTANLGDSRAVVGCLDRPNKIVAEQLTGDHNASLEEVRKELKMSHPEDSQILVLKQGIWRIKGIIQVYDHSYTCCSDAFGATVWASIA